MTLLDAYALIGFLVGGPATAQARALLREGDAAVATANLAEALDVSQRLYGLGISRALDVLDPLFDGTLVAVSLDVGVARRAAEIRAQHYPGPLVRFPLPTPSSSPPPSGATGWPPRTPTYSRWPEPRSSSQSNCQVRA